MIGIPLLFGVVVGVVVVVVQIWWLLCLPIAWLTLVAATSGPAVRLIKSPPGQLEISEGALTFRDQAILRAPVTVGRNQIVSIEAVPPGRSSIGLFGAARTQRAVMMTSYLDRPNVFVKFSSPQTFSTAYRGSVPGYNGLALPRPDRPTWGVWARVADTSQLDALIEGVDNATTIDEAADAGHPSN